MKAWSFSILVICFFVNGYLSGQSSLYPRNEKVLHLLDRYDIIYEIDHNFHSAVQQYYRRDIADIATQIQDDYGDPSTYYLLNDNDEFRQKWNYYSTQRQGIFNTFYKTESTFWEVESDNFLIKINPVIHLSGGNTSRGDNPVFQNTRGIDIRGSIDDRVYFYSSIFENQRRFLPHIENRISTTKAIPGNGFFKPYDSAVIDGLNGWDYLNAEAYVGFQISESVGVEFGHGKHFIGHGYHSLLLGDYAHNYFYLKFNTKFWKLQYQNIFAELSAFGSKDNVSNTLLPKKYMAAHYLDYNITDNFSIGLFETIIFNRINHFEFQYLNPVILYRSVEQLLDSPDNVLIGMTSRLNLLARFQLYGQFMLDELVIGELFSGSGWWGNKYGIQIGAKYVDVLNIPHLDLQVEYNIVRPYTYAHRGDLAALPEFSPASYSHYNQPLAHPLGANFRELLAIIRYQPIERLSANLFLFSTSYGEDIDDENQGGNILRSYESRLNDFNNTIAQGLVTRITQYRLELSYQVFHNAYIDLDLIRRVQSNASRNSNYNYVGVGLRLNIARQRLDY